MPTGRRFGEFSSLEEAIFAEFCDVYEDVDGFNGIRNFLDTFTLHEHGDEDYDVVCDTAQGRIRFEIQISTGFSRYGDLRLDYISAFEPANYWTRTIGDLQRDIDSGRVDVRKWGKLVEPKSHFLLVKFENGDSQWGLYSLPALHQRREEFETIGSLRFNRKENETWGSAFIAVQANHDLLAECSPTSLEELKRFHAEYGSPWP